MNRKLFVTSLVFNFLFLLVIVGWITHRGGVGFLVSKVTHIFYPEQPTMSGLYHAKRALFHHLKIDSNDIVFLGDSITEQFDWAEWFKNPKIKNRGIGTDWTEGVLARLSPIINGKPQKIFLMIGINDMGRGRSIDQIIASYRKVLAALQSGTPSTQVFLQSVLPVDEKLVKIKNSKIILLNDELKKIAREFSVEYIDLFSLLRNQQSGDVDPKYAADGLHLTLEGYQVWASAIASRVQK